MSSLRRILASRANGALACGPVTPQGKQRSSVNSLQHGLLSNIIVMRDESKTAFEDHLRQLIDRLQPLDDVESGIVQDMAAASWRMRRAWAFETRMLDNAVDDLDSGTMEESDPLDRMTAAFTNLANTPALGLLHRYETRLHLMYQRSLHNLLLLRAALPNEPGPDSAPPPALELVPQPSVEAAVPNEPSPISEHLPVLEIVHPPESGAPSLRAVTERNEPNPSSGHSPRIHASSPDPP